MTLKAWKRELYKIIQPEGGWIKEEKSGHLGIFIGDRRILSTSGTPSDNRSLQNFKSQFRRSLMANINKRALHHIDQKDVLAMYGKLRKANLPIYAKLNDKDHAVGFFLGYKSGNHLLKPSTAVRHLIDKSFLRYIKSEDGYMVYKLDYTLEMPGWIPETRTPPVEFLPPAQTKEPVSQKSPEALQVKVEEHTELESLLLSLVPLLNQLPVERVKTHLHKFASSLADVIKEEAMLEAEMKVETQLKEVMTKLC